MSAGCAGPPQVRLGTCNGPGGTVVGGSIAPSVVEAPASTQPLINTYVS